MLLSDVFLGLGQDRLAQLMRNISLGKLRTYQMFDPIRIRLRIAKLNQEGLRKVAPKVWVRLEAHEEELASEVAQAVLVSHLDMIVAVLNLLGVPHTEGFFDKDADIASYLKDNWQQRAFDGCRGRFPEPVLIFYLNHLAHEIAPEAPLFLPGGVN